MDLRVTDITSSPWTPLRKWTGVFARSITERSAGASLEAKQIRIAPGAEIPPHAHEHSTELMYVLSGEGVLKAGAQAVPCVAGNCIQAPPGAVHGLSNTGEDDLQLLAVFTPPLP